LRLLYRKLALPFIFLQYLLHEYKFVVVILQLEGPCVSSLNLGAYPEIGTSILWCTCCFYWRATACFFGYYIHTGREGTSQLEILTPRSSELLQSIQLTYRHFASKMHSLHLRSLLLTPLAVQAINIVLSNDDGWAEKNIRVFYDSLTASGQNVVISAPADNKSGTGRNPTIMIPQENTS
jgi:hypothetical protein